jgi:hypothetical protein
MTTRTLINEETAMTRRTPTGIVLLLALGLAGCDGHSSMPSPPTPPPAAPLPSPVPGVEQELWNLTGTYAGHTGPAACIPPFDATVVQAPIRSVIAIQRSGGSIQVITEHDRYVGDVLADAYSAMDNDNGTWQCGAARFTFRTEGHVSGHFSADGRSLTGEEEVVFRLESGDTITRRWDWHATRQ